jgi:hypothetical protein
MAEWSIEDVAARFAEADDACPASGCRATSTSGQSWHVTPGKRTPRRHPSTGRCRPARTPSSGCWRRCAGCSGCRSSSVTSSGCGLSTGSGRTSLAGAAAAHGPPSVTGSGRSRPWSIASTRRGSWRREMSEYLRGCLRIGAQACGHLRPSRLDGGVASWAVLPYSNGYGWERCGSKDILLLGRRNDAPAPMPFPKVCCCGVANIIEIFK